jgi:hypothetical protein
VSPTLSQDALGTGLLVAPVLPLARQQSFFL